MLAAAVMTETFRTVFNAAMNGEDIGSGTRFVFALHHGPDGKPDAFVKTLPDNAIIATPEELPQRIADSFQISFEHIPAILTAGAERIMRHAAVCRKEV